MLDKLKTKGSLTIVATVCVMLSLLAGFGFLPAASGFNCLWHAMFPQLRDDSSQPIQPRQASQPRWIGCLVIFEDSGPSRNPPVNPEPKQ